MARQFMKLYCDILPRKDLTPAAKVVYTVLADQILGSPSGEVPIGLRRLAKLTGLSVATILRAVDCLIEKTDLLVSRGKHKGLGIRTRNAYRLPPESVLEMKRRPPGGVLDSEQGCTASETGGVLDSERNRTKSETRPYSKRNTSQNKDRPDNKDQKKTKAPPDSDFKLEAGDGLQPKARKPNPLFDAVVELFFPSLLDSKLSKPNSEAITKAGEGARIQRVTTMLEAKGATPDELRIRRTRYRTAWPTVTCTAEAVAKHWDEFAQDRPALSAAGGRPAPDHRAEKRAREFK